MEMKSELKQIYHNFCDLKMTLELRLKIRRLSEFGRQTKKKNYKQ